MTQLKPQQEEAALLIAEKRLSDEQIAVSVGVSRASIARWKRLVVFQARITTLQETIKQQIVAHGLADKRHRVDLLNDAENRLAQVIKERAEDPTMTDVPGGKTGIIVRTYRMIGTGDTATMVEEYKVDTATLAERRATAKQAAQEMGQWSEKGQDVTESKISFTINFDRADTDRD